MTSEQRQQYIEENGHSFELYLQEDTVVKIGDNKYLNQETQHKKVFTKRELEEFFNKEYKN